MPLDAPLDAGRQLISTAADAGVTARLIGGVAIALHSPTALVPPFARDYEDLDIVVGSKSRKKLDDVLQACGFHPDVNFNATHGNERRCYDRPDGQGKVDVFIGQFTMCHTLPLEDRLDVDALTVPLAELFLSKAQIYELNDKDAHDILAMLADHRVGDSDDDEINAARLGEICGGDWGLWRTTMRTLEHLEPRIEELDAEPQLKLLLHARVGELKRALEDAPKNRKWKMRAKIGERVRWYELPEDPDRG